MGIYSKKITVEVLPLDTFYIAEDYHHDYFAKNPENAYCQAVINPKLAKLRLNFSDLISKNLIGKKLSYRFSKSENSNT